MRHAFSLASFPFSFCCSRFLPCRGTRNASEGVGVICKLIPSFSVAHMWLGATSQNCVRGRMCKVWVVNLVFGNRNKCLARPSTLVVESIGVYLVLIEGASHPVPQRAESPPHLGAFLHLLCTILFIFIPWQSRRDIKNNRSVTISYSLLIIIRTSLKLFIQLYWNSLCSLLFCLV